MRYIANDNGYLLEVSFGAEIYCNGRGCTEYTGAVPEGYDSLADWFSLECDKLHRWHIVEGNLTLDENAPEPEVYVPEPEPEPLRMVKLWENATPTSSFAAQTVALDLAGYDGVMVTFKALYNGTDVRVTTGFTPLGVKGVGFLSHGDTDSMRKRHFTATETGVTFETGVKMSDGSSGAGHAIPTAIYGIKGVINGIAEEGAAIAS